MKTGNNLLEEFRSSRKAGERGCSGRQREVLNSEKVISSFIRDNCANGGHDAYIIEQVEAP